jgi:hypothetical protein
MAVSDGATEWVRFFALTHGKTLPKDAMIFVFLIYFLDMGVN